MNIEMEKFPCRILLVCKGNICRSAAAEAVMKYSLPTHLSVRSRGTHGWHEGKCANEKMRSVAIERGYDMEAHVAHQLTAEDLQWATHIFAFDSENYKEIVERFPSANDERLGMFAGDGVEILDPYGQDEVIFLNCFDKIETSVSALLKTIAKQNTF